MNKGTDGRSVNKYLKTLYSIEGGNGTFMYIYKYKNMEKHGYLLIQYKMVLFLPNTSVMHFHNFTANYQLNYQ